MCSTSNLPPARTWDHGVKVLSTVWPGRLPLISPPCAGVEPREGSPLALQLSSNRRDREVGQVPAGVGRIQALAPSEPWSPSQLQPERETAQRQNPRWDLRKEGGVIRNTTSSLEGRTQPMPSAKNHWWCAVGTPYKALSRPSHPSMKRTIISVGWKSPMDHCTVQGS